ncbi:MAG: transglutaminase domain-containing protein [Planctomycetota bacterium]
MSSQGFLQTQPLLTPCDWPFQGLDCAPTASFSLQGASFSERFVGQVVTTQAGGLEALSGAPSAPLTLASATAGDGLTEYLGTVVGLGGGNCAADSLGEGVLACSFQAPQRLVRLTPDFLDGGSALAMAWSSTGQLLGVVQGAGDLVLNAPASGPPIAGCSLVAQDPGGVGWRLYAEPWNRVVALDAQPELNGVPHHTEGYESGPVVRRGTAEGLRLRVHFEQPFDAERLAMRFLLVHDFDGPLTQIQLAEAGGTPNLAAWESELLSLAPDLLSAEYRLNVPVTAAVGRYSLRAQLWLVACGESLLHAADLPEPLVVLFNPWLPADDTYLPGSAALQEYVLATEGLIPRGDAGLLQLRPWRFASFKDETVAAALQALQGQSSAVRSAPYLVARRLSAFVNAEGGGLLVTDFDGSYSPGLSPAVWTGTDQVLAAGSLPQTAVHDWGVAGVLASLCRALGLPARPVTGFNAALDMDGTGALDFQVDAAGHFDPVLTVDRLWDAQSWTEVRLRRPDIAGFNGWQAVHGTPLLLSGGEYKNGPAAVAALFGGQFAQPFDSAWWGPSLNADIRLWRAQSSGGLQLISSNTLLVGNPIQTKAQGTGGLETLTFTYKPGLLPPPGDDPGDATLPETGVVVDFHPPLRADLGQPLDWSLVMVNPTSTPRSSRCVLSAFAALPDGSLQGPIQLFDETVPLPAFTFVVVPFVLQPTLLAQWTGRTKSFRHFADVDITGSSDSFTGWGRSFVTLPPLALTASVPGTLAPGQPASFNAGLVNPLPVALTGVRVVFSAGDGLQFAGQPVGAQHLSVVLPDVAPGGSLSANLTLTALSSGQHSLAAVLESQQLADVAGFLTVDASATWAQLGFGLPGANGQAQLSGSGSLLPGSSGSLSLSQAAPLTSVLMFIGSGAAALPLKGGVFVPEPVLLTLALPSNGAGALTVPWTNFPPGVPAGAQFVFQAWWPDAGGVLGSAASNALIATVP